LGDFVEGLDSDNLNTSVMRGNIELKNLRVKPEAIKKFGFPFNMKSGSVGKINVEVSWTSLTSKPIKILIEDLYILLEP
jgi:vacuolar protein sorting-associated protein 13A/C